MGKCIIEEKYGKSVRLFKKVYLDCYVYIILIKIVEFIFLIFLIIGFC